MPSSETARPSQLEPSLSFFTMKKKQLLPSVRVMPDTLIILLTPKSAARAMVTGSLQCSPSSSERIIAISHGEWS